MRHSVQQVRSFFVFAAILLTDGPPKQLRRCLAFACSFSLIAATAWASVVPSSEAAQRQQTRNDLAAFFAGLGDKTPGPLGAISKSPETMKALQSRINTMSDK